MASENRGATWAELSFHVLEELKRNDARTDELETRVRELERGLVILQTKAALWGIIAGIVAGGLAQFVFKHIGGP